MSTLSKLEAQSGRVEAQSRIKPKYDDLNKEL